MLANNFSTSTCFAIFKLIKFMCFGSTLIYPQEEFLIPRPPRTRSKFNPRPPSSKFNPHPHVKQCGFSHPPPKCEYPRAGLYNVTPKVFYLGGKSCACFRNNYSFFVFQVIFYGQMALICNSILFEINCD